MLKVPINNIFVLLSLLLFAIACNKADEKYEPFSASNISSTVYVSYVDEQGQDLFGQDPDLKLIKIWGRLSNRKIEYTIRKVSIDGVERHVINFGADLPDRKYMKFVSSTTEAYINEEGEGTSTVDLTIGEQHFMLQCNFKYASNIPNDGKDYFGLNGIHLESVICEGVTWQKTDFPGGVLINLCNKNGKIEVLP